YFIRCSNYWVNLTFFFFKQKTAYELDITARKRAEAEMQRLLEREQEAREESERRWHALERVTESRARLMRGFSHDVKNPLGAADGYAALLEDGILGELTDRQLESVRSIRRSIRN